MRHRNQQRGFSLIEVLLVLVILAIGLLGLLSLQVMTLRSGATSRGRETATQIAKGLLDEVQAEAQIEQLQSAYGMALPKGYAPVFGDADETGGTIPFDIQGRRLDSPTEAVFTATWKRLEAKGNTPGTAEYQVRVAWSFEAGAGGAPIARTVSMNRLVTR